MKDAFLFPNNLLENENEPNNLNLNSSFQNDELSSYFPHINLFNQDINNDPYDNNIIMNNNNIFQLEEENLNNKEIIPIKENLKEEPLNKIPEKEKNLSDSSSPLNSTKGSGDKNNESNIKKEKEKEIVGKKRKQRIHLEDLNIDPEIIKNKKYQTIGDKVITSKNSKITDLDRKEIRAIRNRISAQKSRDRKKAEFTELQNRVKYYEELNKKLNMIIKDFENISCTECKAKFMEIKLNKSLEQDINMEKDYLVLDEDVSFFSSDKKGSILTKLTGGLITLVCLIGIIL